MLLFKKKSLSEESLGDKLRLAREEKNISLEEAAAKLNISQTYLSALEKGSYGSLPGGIYEKIFLKKYSAFLGIRPVETLKEYENERSAPKNESDVFSKKKIEKKYFLVMPKILKNILLALGFLLLFSYLAFSLKIFLAKPKIEIFFPPDNLITSDKKIEVSGRASEKNQISVNNKPILKDEAGNFKEAVELKEGLNTIIISAKNKYGREQIIKKQILVK